MSEHLHRYWSLGSQIFIYLLMLLILGILAYAVSYHGTFLLRGGTNIISRLQSDILLESSLARVEAHLRDRGYEIDHLTALGTHRSVRYYADVLDGFTPFRQDPAKGSDTYLLRDKRGEYYFIKTDPQQELIQVESLRH